MTTTTRWILTISTVVATVVLVAALAFAIFAADTFGKAVNDRACVEALDGLRAERAAATNGPELQALGVIADRYCSEVGRPTRD